MFEILFASLIAFLIGFLIGMTFVFWIVKRQGHFYWNKKDSKYVLVFKSSTEKG